RKVSPQELADFLEANVTSRFQHGERDLGEMLGKEADYIRSLGEKGKLSLKEAEELKSSFNSKAKFDSATPGRSTRAYQQFRGGINSFNEEAMQQIDPALAAQYAKIKQSQSNLIPAEKIADDYASRMNANRFL